WRQVDPAGDDDDGGANRSDTVDRRVLEDQEDVAEIQEGMRPSGLGHQVPVEEQHLGEQNRHGAELALPPEAIHWLIGGPPCTPPGSRSLRSRCDARSTRSRPPSSDSSCVASCITASSVAVAPASAPRSSPSRMTRIRSASASTSGRSLDTIKQAIPAFARARIRL